MQKIKEYKWSIVFLIILFIIYLINHKLGVSAANIAAVNLGQMLLLVPPIFIIMGLLDVWIPREVLIKYMGHEAGISGVLIAFLLGTAAAGPLYVAFPIGLLLLKKGARLAFVIFFFGIWSSTKLPIMLFEVASLGLKFTLIHIFISVPLYLMASFMIERSISKKEIEEIIAAE